VAAASRCKVQTTKGVQEKQATCRLARLWLCYRTPETPPSPIRHTKIVFWL